jgi:hypothetical protein
LACGGVEICLNTLIHVSLLLLLQAHRGEGGDAMDVDGEEDELLVSGTGVA